MSLLQRPSSPVGTATAGGLAPVEPLSGVDEAAIRELLDRHAASMLRLALVLCPSRAVADQVLQETWLVVISDLQRLEGRSSPRGWIFGILAGKAEARAVRDGRRAPLLTPFAAEDAGEACVDPKRFLPADDVRQPRRWATPPRPWDQSPERCLGTARAKRVLGDALERLDSRERLVIVMRDVEGWGAHDVCIALNISQRHQRVLLRRGRARVHAALERHVDAASRGTPPAPSATRPWR